MESIKPRIEEAFYRTLWADAEAAVQTAKSESDETTLLSKVRTILAQRNPHTGLTKTDAALLLQSLRAVKSDELRSSILDASRSLRQKLYSNHVATMVPLEISSYCMSNCEFCGWRSKNKDMLRLKVSMQALEMQTRYLARSGFSHFEIASGDDLVFIKNELPEAIQRVKTVAKETQPDARVSICLTPLLEEHYRHLKSQGLDTVLTWQETYSEGVFKKYITGGPKALGITADYKVDTAGDGWLARMKSHESVVRANLQVGLGAMIGLSPNPEAEILSVIMHGQKLINHYAETIQPLIIGMPTWNAITTKDTDNYQTHEQPLDVEDAFELVAAIYLLSFPDHHAWVFPNCRVSKETQLRSIETAGCFTSTMVRVGPGAYLEQIETSNLSEAFSKSSKPKEELTRNNILDAEQFVHHYHTHDDYIREFQTQGLVVVSDRLFVEIPGRGTL